MIVIDVEASGLSDDSYPLEIAWVNVENGESDTFLINPETSCLPWNHWDEEAQWIHSIPRYRAVEDGIDVKSACKRLNSALAGKFVCSDGGRWDRFWIRVLFDGAGLHNPRRQLFKIADVMLCFHPLWLPDFAAKLEAAERPHRALPDAQAIAKAISSMPAEAIKTRYLKDKP